MSALVGKRFGNYHIMALLGEGGMATVYRAQQVAMQREVAIKVIRSELAADDHFVKRFEREAQLVASLSHPHILKIFEYGWQKKKLFLVMELLTGGSLAGHIRNRALPLETVSGLLSQICSALDYAHGLGIVHRDLKPQNVLLDGNGNAILTDFGLAKLLVDTGKSALTQSGAQMGTPLYMSPEQWRADAIDHRADLYALGAMMFEMLTGTHPFKSETSYDLMHKHLYVAPPSLRKLRNDLPSSLEQVIRRALAKDREERYPSAKALYEAYEAAIRADVPVIAPVATQSHDNLEDLVITASQAKAQEREAIARLEAEKNDRSKTPRSTTQRLVGILPQDISERYIGRAKQVADVANLLVEKTRLVSIYGRGGVGKTALACKVLSDLQMQDTVDGIVSLSAANGTARFDRILGDFGRILGNEDRALLEVVMRDGQIPVAQKTAVLLEKLRDGRYIVFLDNLETLQDPSTGMLTDPDLQTFFETVLEQGGTLRILVTSREPLTVSRALKTWERLVPLDEGLPEDEAIALLRAFDPDGTAGLRNASDEQLTAIAQKTGGFPRALEIVAGLLLDDPLLSLDDLIHDIGLLSGEITPIIVQQAIARLSPDSLRVMEGLALMGRPANQTALEFLLAPFMDTSKLRNLLAHLVRTYFVTFNKTTQQFALHPMDRTYCYEHIPTDSHAAYNRSVLHTRASEYYRRQRKPQSAWRSVEDVTPQLAEFDHLIAVGNYDEAAQLLLSIDRDYLWDWGQRTLLEELHGRLHGHIADTRLAHQNLRRIAWGRFSVNLDEATAMFETLFAEAQRTGDRQTEADALDDLAQCRRGKGDMRQGFQLHQQALEIYRQIGDKRGQAEALGGMGASAGFMWPDIAVNHLTEAVAIQRELNNQQSIVFLLWALANCYNALGQFEQAVDYSQQTITLAKNMNNTTYLARTWSQLGQIYSYAGDYDKAFESSNQAVTTAQSFAGGKMTGEVVATHVFLSLVQVTSGNLERAFQTMQKITADPTTQSRFVGGVWGLLPLLHLLKGEVQQAREGVTRALSTPLPPNFKIQHGLILACSGATDLAISAFEDVLNLLQMASPTFLNLHIRALALAGLGLLTGDATKVQAAAESYREARAAVNAPGYEQYQLTLLNTLMQVPGGEVLAPVRAALVE